MDGKIITIQPKGCALERTNIAFTLCQLYVSATVHKQAAASDDYLNPNGSYLSEAETIYFMP